MTAQGIALRLSRLRLAAILAPLAFAVGLGLLTDQVLEPQLPQHLAHIVATAILALAIVAFTFSVFGILQRMQNEADRHRERERERTEMIARLAERERIGMELHDGVIQTVYGIQLGLEAAGVELRSSPEGAARRLDDAVEQLTCVAERMRQYIFALRPYLTSDGDLTRAMRDLLENVHRNAAVETELTMDERAVEALDAQQARTVFRLTEQALACAKQRNPTRISVTLAAGDEGVRLEVRDNGRRAARRRARGIPGELASVDVPGRAEVEVSSDEGGTRLAATLASSKPSA